MSGEVKGEEEEMMIKGDLIPAAGRDEVMKSALNLREKSTIAGPRRGPRKPFASFAALRLPRSWEDHIAEAHLGNEAL